MNTSYQVTKIAGGDVFLSPGSSSLLAKVDAVVFDCDGTLIDVRESYDSAVVKTTTGMIEGFFGRVLPLDQDAGEFILKIRQTGGFNSDWDLTYALSLFSAVALGGPSSDANTLVLERLRGVVTDFASRERLAGWASVDEYLNERGKFSGVVKEMRAYLGYPGEPLTSRLATTFDNIYYGPTLYRRVYGAEPMSGLGDGLIDRETKFIRPRTLALLEKMLGRKKMAMATGRPYIAVEHTLGTLLEYFERDASIYIGDGDIVPDLAAKLAKYRKPSGESLLLARKQLSSKVLLYVGDSGEDRLMVRNAVAPKGSIIFAGIYGSSSSEEEQIAYFTKNESELVVRDVNQIPAVLEMIRN